MTKNGHRSSSSYWGAGTTTTISIALVLLLLGLTILVGFIGQRITSFVKENITITIELSDAIKDSEITKLQNQLKESAFAKEVKFISKEDIKKQLISDLGKDPEEIIGYNPASNCFEINLNANYANADSVTAVEKMLKGKNIINDISYDQDDLEMVNSNLTKIGGVLLILAIILTFISFTLIRNTIRLNIYSKRFTINTMQLVGATNSFIRKPFVVHTVVLGIIAAIISNVLITVFIYSFAKEYPELMSIIQINDLLAVYVIVFVLGILITFWATRSAVNKYLKMSTNNLYYI